MVDISAGPSAETRIERRKGPRHVWFLNSAFDRIGMETALKRVSERDADKPFAFVVTPNVDHLVRLESDSVLARLYAQAWLTVCDSRVLELLGKLSGERIEVSPGSDMTEALFEDHIDPEETVAIIGGDAAVVEKVRQRYGLKDVRWHKPPMGLREKPAAIAECARFVSVNKARFTFICVGSPQQELIAEACLDRGDCTGVGLCVGASLDFLGGKAERAPVWMRKSRLEWLHRLASEPGRLWKRYLVDGPKIFFLWRRWKRARRELAKLEQALSTRHASRERDLINRIRDLEREISARSE